MLVVITGLFAHKKTTAKPLELVNLTEAFQRRQNEGPRDELRKLTSNRTKYATSTRRSVRKFATKPEEATREHCTESKREGLPTGSVGNLQTDRDRTCTSPVGVSAFHFCLQHTTACVANSSSPPALQISALGCLTAYLFNV